MTTPYRDHLCRRSDIQEHLGLLHGLASLDRDNPIRPRRRVVELGFRTGVSASAFLAAGAFLHSVDNDPSCKPHVRRLAALYPETFTFKVEDSTYCEIPECDLLFIDTDHTYKTTLAELQRHESKVSELIVLHDTVSFGRKDRKPGDGPGVLTAVETFLDLPDSQWWLHLHLPNNNGLTILRRREPYG